MGFPRKSHRRAYAGKSENMLNKDTHSISIPMGITRVTAGSSVNDAFLFFTGVLGFISSIVASKFSGFNSQRVETDLYY